MSFQASGRTVEWGRIVESAAIKRTLARLLSEAKASSWRAAKAATRNSAWKSDASSKHEKFQSSPRKPSRSSPSWKPRTKANVWAARPCRWPVFLPKQERKRQQNWRNEMRRGVRIARRRLPLALRKAFLHARGIRIRSALVQRSLVSVKV